MRGGDRARQHAPGLVAGHAHHALAVRGRLHHRRRPCGGRQRRAGLPDLPSRARRPGRRPGGMRDHRVGRARDRPGHGGWADTTAGCPDRYPVQCGRLHRFAAQPAAHPRTRTAAALAFASAARHPGGTGLRMEPTLAAHPGLGLGLLAPAVLRVHGPARDLRHPRARHDGGDHGHGQHTRRPRRAGGVAAGQALVEALRCRRSRHRCSAAMHGR